MSGSRGSRGSSSPASSGPGNERFSDSSPQLTSSPTSSPARWSSRRETPLTASRGSERDSWRRKMAPPNPGTPASRGSDSDSWRKPAPPNPAPTREGSPSSSSDTDPPHAAATTTAIGSKRRGNDSWAAGRGGMGWNCRNTPGGRGFSSTRPTAPAIGRRSDSSSTSPIKPEGDGRFSSPRSQRAASSSPPSSRRCSSWGTSSPSDTPARGRSDIDCWRKPASPDASLTREASPDASLTREGSASPTPFHNPRRLSVTMVFPSRSDCPTWKKVPTAPPTLSNILRDILRDPSGPDILVCIDDLEWPSSGREGLYLVEVNPGILGRAPHDLLPIQSPLVPSIGQQSGEVAQPNTAGALDAMFEKWQLELVSFLNLYRESSHDTELYKAYLNMLNSLNNYDFIIDFNHLLNWNRDLAYIVCNGQGRDDKWLQKAVTSFMNENNLQAQAGKVIFNHMPESLKTGADVFSSPSKLVMPVKLFQEKEAALISTFHCSEILDVIFTGLFTRLRARVSWRGKLTLKDFEFVKRAGVLQVIIRKDPEILENASNEDRALDINSLWPMVESVVTWRGYLPLYFEELKNDLLGATADEVAEEWYEEYICYHPSQVSSMARRDLESGLHQSVGQWHLDWNPQLQEIFIEKPMLLEDWRHVMRSDPYLKVNYEHENPGMMQQGKPNVDKVKGQDEGVKGQDEGVKGQDEAAQQKVTAAKETSNDRYANSMRGLLEFKRHVNQHPRVRLDEIDESEVFLAGYCSGFLPKLIKGLLRTCRMSSKFASLWSAYKVRKSDPWRLPEPDFGALQSSPTRRCSNTPEYSSQPATAVSLK